MDMNPRRRQAVYWLCALVVAGVQPGLPGAIDANPYLSIVERNPFGLKPPPPPAPEPSPEDSAPPPAKVTLTGLTTMFGEPRALLEIIEQEGGKPGTPLKPILSLGQRSGSVELLSIDMAKNQVRIRNGSLESDLTFEVVKASAGPGSALGPGPGGRPMPNMLLPPTLPTAYAHNPGGPGAPGAPGAVPSPTVVSPGSAGGSGGAGVTLLGAATSAAAVPAATSARPTMMPLPIAAPAAQGSSLTTRVLPTRRPRIDMPYPTQPTAR